MKHLFKKQDLTLEQKMLQGIIFTCYLILTTIKFFFIDNILEFKNIKTAYNIFELIFFAILIFNGAAPSPMRLSQAINNKATKDTVTDCLKQFLSKCIIHCI